jgi:hypothetical protein
MVACGGVVESRLQAAVRLRGPGMRLEALAIPDVNSGRIGLVVMRGKRHRRGPSCFCHPSRMLCPSRWMIDTAVLVNTIWQPRSAKGPKPMRVWGNDGMTCPRIDAGGRDGAEARVALATDFSGRPFATRTATVGAFGSRLATGASGAK